MESNNKRFIYLGFTFLFFCGFLVTALGVYEHVIKLDKIQQNSDVINATINEEVIKKSTEIQTVGFKLEYYYMGKLYVKKVSGLTNRKTGDIIKIIIEKENPENFIVLENINYSSEVVFSLACLFASILMFVFRNEAISLWRKIAPEY